MGIALGVALVVAVDISVISAQRSFERSNSLIIGNATHQVVASSAGFSEENFVSLTKASPFVPMVPVIEAQVMLAEGSSFGFTLLGIDPLRDGLFRSAGSTRLDYYGSLADLLRKPNSVVVDRNTAVSLGKTVGDSILITAGGREVSVEIVGWIGLDDATSALTRHLMIADLSSTQEILGRFGKIDRVDVILDSLSIELFQKRLPIGLVLQESGNRLVGAEAATSAFRLNLSLLSMLALIIGLFLIYNIVSFSVVQRYALFGILRALGATRHQILLMSLVEALLIGGMGSVCGLVLGGWLSKFLIVLVVQTVNDLYFPLNEHQITLSFIAIGKALLLGLVGSVFAALIPALEATRVRPRELWSHSTIETRIVESIPTFTLVALAMLTIAGLLVVLSEDSLLIGYLALACGVIGFSFLTPMAITQSVLVLKLFLSRRTSGLGILALGWVATSLSRTTVAVAALMVALGGAIGVGNMIESFRYSVDDWLKKSLEADIYVYITNSSQNNLNVKLVSAIRSLGDLEIVTTRRVIHAMSGSGTIEVLGVDLPNKLSQFSFVRGNTESMWVEFNQPSSVIVSESYMWHQNIEVGDEIAMLTDLGWHSFKIVGVYRDYGSERGAVTMSHRNFESYWHDIGVSSMGLYLSSPDSVGHTLEAIQILSRDIQSVNVRSTRDLRSGSLEVFDRTFAITNVLKLLTILVAFVGVFSSFMAVHLDRVREVGILRVIGSSRLQVWFLFSVQSGLLGLITGILCLPLSIGIAYVLAEVINQRAFGWSFDLIFSLPLMIEVIVLAVVVAVLASIYPAYKLTQEHPVKLLRND